MKSTAHIAGHPIHPMLIPYPFALLTAATVFDIAASVRSKPSWAQTGRHLTLAGLGTALVAALPGVIDYFGSVPRHSAARRTATRHALCNVSALACFAIGEARRRVDGRLPPAGLSLAAIGTGLMGVAGWFGGELVYHERIGVTEGDESSSGIRIAERQPPAIG